MTDLLFKDEVYAIVGAAMEVYNELGPGFWKRSIKRRLRLNCSERGIPFESQKELADSLQRAACSKRPTLPI